MSWISPLLLLFVVFNQKLLISARLVFFFYFCARTKPQQLASLHIQKKKKRSRALPFSLRALHRWCIWQRTLISKRERKRSTHRYLAPFFAFLSSYVGDLIFGIKKKKNRICKIVSFFFFFLKKKKIKNTKKKKKTTTKKTTTQH